MYQSYIISYDSITNQKGYISEKIFDCFKAKTIPVYWGADNVTEYIPKECFVDKRDFNNYDELYNYLKNMTEEEYNQFVENVKRESLYNIDATANYGDQLITLSTCSYYVEDGRFAVVGRRQD